MALVLGLGNPGARYARTRHNVGWRVLEELARRWQSLAEEHTADYHARTGLHAGRAVQLVWPLGFMNLSGMALSAWRERHPFEPGELMVVADDVYLPVGWLRLRERGSSGGHRGLESIEAALGSQEYARLRIGVGGADAAALREHVLETFDAEEETGVSEAVTQAANAVECWSIDGVTAAMNRFNRRVPREVSEP